jgi:lipoyl-dependent peroxiredoxin
MKRLANPQQRAILCAPWKTQIGRRMKTLYTAYASSSEGRNGHTKSSDGVVDLELSMPKSMGGAGKEGATNPEQLFACGYSACFGGAVAHVAKLQKRPIQHVEVNAEVTIGLHDGGGLGLSVVLKVRIPELARADAEALVHAAHQVCPYSVATRGNMPVTLEILD